MTIQFLDSDEGPLILGGGRRMAEKNLRIYIYYTMPHLNTKNTLTGASDPPSRRPQQISGFLARQMLHPKALFNPKTRSNAEKNVPINSFIWHFDDLPLVRVCSCYDTTLLLGPKAIFSSSERAAMAVVLDLIGTIA